MDFARYKISIKQELKVLKAEINDGGLEQSMKELRTEFLIPLALAILTPSLVFILFCFPATIVFSQLNGFDWPDIIFFNNLPKEAIFHKYTIFPIPVSGSKIEYPLLCSLLTAYGTIGIVATLLIYSNSLLRIFITCNGIYCGYFTVYFGVYCLSYLDFSNRNLGNINLFSLKLLYVLLVFYLLEAFIDLFAKKDYRGDKFRFLFPGLQGLLTGWILEKEFSNNSAVLNGIFFLLSTFVAIYIIEILVGQSLKMIENLSIKTKNIQEYMKPKMFDAEEMLIATKKCWGESRVIILIVGIINITFPFIAYTFWKWILVK